jgi:hypothetical protein
MKPVFQAALVLALAGPLLPEFQSVVDADERRVHAKAGSYWNYEVTDQIRNTKLIYETTLTEVKDQERVMRSNTRGLANYVINLFDENWNLLEGGSFKYEPHMGNGLPGSLAVGSQSSTELTIRQQQQNGWTDAGPAAAEAKIVAAEPIATKAGKFETLRLESWFKSTAANAQLLNSETTYIVWFSPELDHWIRFDLEQRSSGRLVLKTRSELIEYEVR